MKCLAWMTGGAAVLLGLVLIVGQSDAQADKLTAKDIMVRLNKRDTSLFPTIRSGLNANAPAWDDLQRQTKEMVGLVEALGQKVPPQGDKDSWAKLTKTYVADAKALESAARQKSKDEMLAVHKRMTGACKVCHDVHRPK